MHTILNLLPILFWKHTDRRLIRLLLQSIAVSMESTYKLLRYLLNKLDRWIMVDAHPTLVNYVMKSASSGQRSKVVSECTMPKDIPVLWYTLGWVCRSRYEELLGKETVVMVDQLLMWINNDTVLVFAIFFFCSKNHKHPKSTKFSADVEAKRAAKSHLFIDLSCFWWASISRFLKKSRPSARFSSFQWLLGGTLEHV